MKKYQEITAARKILELPERATMDEIKASYRRMLSRWHPDKCKADKDECAEMTRKIIFAYQTIMDYCLHYQYSFSEDTATRHQSPEDWWFERFGDDPLWGNGGRPKWMPGWWSRKREWFRILLACSEARAIGVWSTNGRLMDF